MSQQKKQHYVPRFYLRNFSSDGKRINLWNISLKKKMLSKGLKGQCQKNFFYGRDRIFEQILGDIEAGASTVLRDVVKDRKLPPQWHKNYKDLMLYILIQHFRTQNSSEALIDSIKQKKNILKKYEGRVREGLVKEIDRECEMTEQVAPQMGILSAFKNFDSVAELAIKLLINKTQTEFVTSDHPVVLYNQLLNYDREIQQKIRYPTTGLVAKGVQLFFPISPTKALLMYDDHVYSIGNSDKNNIPIYHKQDVTAINMLQMCSGSQNIYFKDGAFDVEKLHNISEPYMKKILTDLYLTPEPKIEDFTDSKKTKSGFSIISFRGIHTDLNLPFIRLKPDAKEFQAEVKRSIKKGIVPVRKFWRKLPMNGTGTSSPFADKINLMKKNIVGLMKKVYIEANRRHIGEHWYQALQAFLKIP